MKPIIAPIFLLLAATSVASSPPKPDQVTFNLQATSTCILPSVTASPTSDDIGKAIAQWNFDVEVVNSFLWSAPFLLGFPKTLQSAAKLAYSYAIDEPCQFTTLQAAYSKVDYGSQEFFNCTVNDLNQHFGDVLTNLSSIISDPSNALVAVSAIQANRCCNVIPDVSILFLLTGQSGVDNWGAYQFPRTPIIPTQCHSYTCPDTCDVGGRPWVTNIPH